MKTKQCLILMGLATLIACLSISGNVKAADYSSKACQLGKYLQSNDDNDGDDCPGHTDDDDDKGEAIPSRIFIGI